jgi:Zn-dependent protease
VTSSDFIFFGCLLVAVILHEVSHGVVALAFGDDTAKRAGRLTLNPLPHIDPVGSLLLPGMLVLAGLPPFGWAKPVPVNPAKLRNPRRSMLFVGLIGPISNFTLMLLAAIAARALRPAVVTGIGVVFHDTLLNRVIVGFAFVNMFLGLFNLLPIPPLDGSAILERALPRHWLPKYWQVRQYGFLVLIILVFWLHILDRLFLPFEHVLARFIAG